MKKFLIFSLAILIVGCTCSRDEDEKLNPYPDGKINQQQNPR